MRQHYAAQSGKINQSEINWLARSLRIAEGAVEEWWAMEDEKRMGEKMWMIWAAKREVERGRWYREKGIYWYGRMKERGT